MPVLTDTSFENREEKPIDELYFHLPNDDTVKAPAVDKRWTSRSVFSTYISLITANGRLKSGVELEEWQHVAESFREDMQYLLQRPHHVFWSYMVHQKSAIASIVSFLQHATPFYLDLNTLNATPENITLYEHLLGQVVRVICRLITNKETPNAWIKKNHLSDLIYSNYLITVPMMFDLVIALGDSSSQNSSILRRIFETVLELQPKYKGDLLTALAFFRAAFRSIQTQADNEGFEGAGGGALDDCAETPYDDVVLYTLDCSYSLSVLLEICPLVRQLCTEINLGKSIAQFYDTVIPNLYKNVCQINELAESLSWLDQARLQYLYAFRIIVNSHMENVLTNPDNRMQVIESFLALMTDCLSEQTFVIDYEHQYPIAMDMDIIKQACPDLDEFKANFVLNGYQQEAQQADFRTYNNIQKVAKSVQETDIERYGEQIPIVNGLDEIKNEAPVGAVAATAIRDIDLEVTAVLDILPHLGTGFVRRVLSRYENSDLAVAAILEENLPPDLINADQSEPYIPPDLQDKVYQETGVKHFNVYDGDAYDVMTQDNPDCIIKRGKGFPNAPRNAAQLLDDKTDLAKIRHRYEAYSLVTEDENLEDNANAEYDDEYDDSYEALLESETRVVRSKELKAGLANVEDNSDDNDDEVDSDEEKASSSNNRTQDKRMNFCENPEDIRARYEAKRQAKWERRGGSGGGASGGNESKKCVVGAPKGQGQDKETLRSRQKKEANKSSRANHNRKAGAAFKRSKGMIS